MTLPTLSLEDQAELRRLEEGLWTPALRYDLAFQEARIAADFIEFGRSGRIYQREEVIRTEAAPFLARLPLDDLRFRVLDVNTVQLTYNSAAEYEGVVEYARRSSLWSRGPAGWVMRFHQGTPYQP